MDFKITSMKSQYLKCRSTIFNQIFEELCHDESFSETTIQNPRNH